MCWSNLGASRILRARHAFLFASERANFAEITFFGNRSPIKRLQWWVGLAGSSNGQIWPLSAKLKNGQQMFAPATQYKYMNLKPEFNERQLESVRLAAEKCCVCCHKDVNRS